MVAAIVAVLVLVACEGAPSKPSGSSAGAESSPGRSTAVVSTPTEIPSVSSGEDASAIIDEGHGLTLSLPEGWFGITPADSRNVERVEELQGSSAERADHVDALIDALKKHPEYWFAAMRESDEAVATGQLREFDDFDVWRSEQQAALENAYGRVAVQFVKLPRDGWSFSWLNRGAYFEMVAFERPGGAALFVFAGPATSNGLPALWDEVYAKFTDAGR
jgi:hypothetical protein